MDNILMKNKLDIMTEAASTEDFAVNNAMDNMTESDLVFALENVMTLAYDLEYPIESIPVMEQESAYDGKKLYVVEYDMLYKIMESYDVDEVEALNMLAEVNKIDIDDLYLAIESLDYFEEKMKEAGCKGGSNLKAKKTQNVIKSVNDLKAKGIKLTKKPKKSKKKKSRKKGLLGIEGKGKYSEEHTKTVNGKTKTHKIENDYSYKL